MKTGELADVILRKPGRDALDLDVVVVRHGPGELRGPTPHVRIERALAGGIDWDRRLFLLYPEQPVTTLTPEQVAEITASARGGQSWHAYQRYKEHQEEVARLKARIAELECGK